MISEKHTWVFYTVEDVANGIQVSECISSHIYLQKGCFLIFHLNIPFKFLEKLTFTFGGSAEDIFKVLSQFSLSFSTNQPVKSPLGKGSPFERTFTIIAVISPPPPPPGKLVIAPSCLMC